MQLRFWTLSVRPPQDDFEHVLGAVELVLSDQKKSFGRDGDGNPLWIQGDVYRYGVTTEGVRAQSGILNVDKAGAQFTVVECDADHTVASAVHAHADHEVLAAVLHPSEDPADVGAGLATALEGWDPDVEFTGARRTSARDFLVAQGVPMAWLTAWVNDNPGGTPRDFYRDLRAWAKS